jgi:glycosyltransferase involved in cell wall biosynthesis
MIRVLHVVWNLAGGGAERIVLELCRRAPPDIAPTVAPLAPGGELEDAFRAAGVRVLPPARRGRVMGPRGLRRLVRAARGADLVHTHLWAGDAWGRLAAARAGVPVLTTEHNTRPDAGWRGWVATRMSPLSTRVACVSAAARAAAVAQGGDPSRLVVVPNGIDLSRFRPLPPADPARPRVVFLGRLEPQKGPDLLLEALDRLGDLPGLAADLYGEGRLRAALERRARTLPVPVRLPGWTADVQAALAPAAVVVVPSRWEGFGLSAVEALASGRPVVASAVDALPEVVGSTGVLVRPEDPAALAAALRRLLSDPARLRALAAAGPARAARFGLDATVATYATHYRELVSR